MEINNDKETNKINLNEGIECIDIKPENLSLYLNMIGGHSFFVEYTKKISKIIFFRNYFSYLSIPVLIYQKNYLI